MLSNYSEIKYGFNADVSKVKVSRDRPRWPKGFRVD